MNKSSLEVYLFIYYLLLTLFLLCLFLKRLKVAHNIKSKQNPLKNISIKNIRIKNLYDKAGYILKQYLFQQAKSSSLFLGVVVFKPCYNALSNIGESLPLFMNYCRLLFKIEWDGSLVKQQTSTIPLICNLH